MTLRAGGVGFVLECRLLLMLPLVRLALGIPLLLVELLEVGYTLSKSSWDAIRSRGAVILCQPWMTHNGVQIGSPSGIGDEHEAQEVASFSGDVVGEGEGRVDDILVEEIDIVTIGVGRVVVEGEISCQHSVEDDTATPDINCASDVETLADNKLRCSITGASAGRLHEVVSTVLESVGEPEIGDDHVAVTVEKQILELEVAMDDFLLVDVPNAGYELGEQLCSVLFAQISMGQNVVEQFAAGCVLKDDTDVFIRLDHVVESNNVGMLQSLRRR